ncbi:MAG: histidine triad nucleotide-binding protein [Candidatus Kapabacteria bacterium]|nr:histidine triad nucleotide-binding protein [Candidatus Kapabacteria bacterium]
MSDSIFTKIIKREIPASIVYEDDEIIAFNDISPQAPIHIVIVTKMQIETLNDLNSDNAYLIGKIALAAKQIAKDKGIDKSGYRLIMNCNDDGGQTVFHIHCHLLGGKKLSWNPA